MRTVNIERWGESFRLVYTRRGRVSVPAEMKEDNCYVDDAEVPQGRVLRDEDGGEQVRSDVDRLENNIARARSRVRELAFCNDWDYFFTATLAPDKQDRFDLSAFRRRFGEWVGNFNKKYAVRIAYVLIPEQHKNGAWHAHGLLYGLPSAALRTNRYGYLSLPDYERRFGFCSLSPIASRRRVGSYITKYISKDFSATAHEAGEHLFYSSHGLRGKSLLGSVPVDDSACADYEGEWCGISWVESFSELGGRLARLASETDKMEQYKILDSIQRELSKKTDNWTIDKILQTMSVSGDIVRG
jgi:hypothetical protein